MRLKKWIYYLLWVTALFIMTRDNTTLLKFGIGNVAAVLIPIGLVIIGIIINYAPLKKAVDAAALPIKAMNTLIVSLDKTNKPVDHQAEDRQN
jgi:uncharacterized membrane protein